MIFLEQNIKGICQKFGIDFLQLISDFQVDNVYELSISDLEALVEEYEIDLQALLFKPLFKSEILQLKLASIKMLILDVDGVMTDGGMYMTEKGDQIKKFDTKDGRGIIELIKKKFHVVIISSGFKDVGVSARAKMLGIERCYIGLEPKLKILKSWCEELQISLDEVAMIGDDINDLEVMRTIGFSACPADAVENVKQEVDLILSKKGGRGCVREFIDNYLEAKPLSVLK
jgi:3-deoxy-D-manno-octulosonate 8-phosphate phosphatase (KDO 8-P phosphatase)